MTPAEAKVALVHDHVANHHAAKPWPGCPVCESLKGANR
jgi:hypothetical protein